MINNFSILVVHYSLVKQPFIWKKKLEWNKILYFWPLVSRSMWRQPPDKTPKYFFLHPYQQLWLWVACGVTSVKVFQERPDLWVDKVVLHYCRWQKYTLYFSTPNFIGRWMRKGIVQQEHCDCLLWQAIFFWTFFNRSRHFFVLFSPLVKRNKH